MHRQSDEEGMAPPRKSVRQPGEGHKVAVRLSEEIFFRLDAKAKSEGRPLSRIISDDLARVPWLEAQTQLGKLITIMERILLHHGTRLTTVTLETELLRSVDRLLEAKPGEVQARIDGLKLLRAAMANRERAGLLDSGDMKWGVDGTPMEKFDEQ
jgi:hypothetical protein